MKFRAMLVDDIDLSNFILKKVLQQISPQIEIFDFTDSVRAFESIEEINPDIIFLDLNMPVMHGWTFLDQMMKKDYHYRVAIVTSSTSILDKNRGKQYPNVIDYCEKPLNRQRLMACLNKFAVTNVQPAKTA